MIEIDAGAKKIIYEDAISCYPEECCGVMLGSLSERRVTEVIVVNNTFDEAQKKRRFLIDEETMLRAELMARKNKKDIVGFYHSHPDHPAIPSDYDLSHALPVYSYVITSVAGGKIKDIRSYVLTEKPTEKYGFIFTEEEIK